MVAETDTIAPPRPPLKVVCMDCRKTIQDGPPDPVSHGECMPCMLRRLHALQPISRADAAEIREMMADLLNGHPIEAPVPWLALRRQLMALAFVMDESHKLGLMSRCELSHTRDADALRREIVKLANEGRTSKQTHELAKRITDIVEGRRHE